MDWTERLDGYCERLGPSFWAEPVNAATNIAFVLAALIMWNRSEGIGRVLCVILAAIGVGSFLFHTYATMWAMLTDVLPILLFILVYVFAANRDFWGMRAWVAGVGTALFVPYAAATGWVFGALPFFEISAGYWPVALLIAIYGFLLRDRYPATGRGLLIGAGILTLSLTFRSLDMPVCDALPLGTHFMWHVLNGIMLGWMIHVHARHLRRYRSTS